MADEETDFEGSDSGSEYGGGDDNDLISIDQMRTAILEKDAETAFHKVDGGFMVRKRDENTGDFCKEEEISPTDKLSPQIKLQLYYRKCFEYRMAHAFEAADMNFKANFLTFFTLILSSMASILLLSGSSGNTEAPNEHILTGGAVLSALITFCTGLASYMGYSTRFELHSVSVADFTKLQRDLVTLIQTETTDEISKQFEEVADKFNVARSRMPLLYPDYLEAYRDEHGKRIFKRIIDSALEKESMENVTGMSDLGLFEIKGVMKDALDLIKTEHANSKAETIEKVTIVKV